MVESMGEGGLGRIRSEVLQACASATNFRPGAVLACSKTLMASGCTPAMITCRQPSLHTATPQAQNSEKQKPFPKPITMVPPSLTLIMRP